MSAVLITAAGIDHPGELVATPKARNVVHDKRCQCLEVAAWWVGNVRGDQDIWQFPQRVVWGKWLWARHVEARTAESPMLERVDEGLCVDESTSCHVNQPSARPEQRQLSSADKGGGGSSKRRGQNREVAHLEQVVERAGGERDVGLWHVSPRASEGNGAHPEWPQ